MILNDPVLRLIGLLTVMVGGVTSAVTVEPLSTVPQVKYGIAVGATSEVTEQELPAGMLGTVVAVVVLIDAVPVVSTLFRVRFQSTEKLDWIPVAPSGFVIVLMILNDPVSDGPTCCSP